MSGWFFNPLKSCVTRFPTLSFGHFPPLDTYTVALKVQNLICIAGANKQYLHCYYIRKHWFWNQKGHALNYKLVEKRVYLQISYQRKKGVLRFPPTKYLIRVSPRFDIIFLAKIDTQKFNFLYPRLVKNFGTWTANKTMCLPSSLYRVGPEFPNTFFFSILAGEKLNYFYFFTRVCLETSLFLVPKTFWYCS